MEYIEKYNKILMGIKLAMIAFAIAIIIMFIANGFSVPNILLFVINATNFALFQFTNQNKIICAIVCVFLGILSNVLGLNIIAVIGVILIVLGILAIYYNYKSKD